MRFFKRLMITTLLILFALAFLGYIFLQQATFGTHPANNRLTRIQKSKNYRDGSFQNLSPTDVMAKGVPPTKMMRDYLNKSPENSPKTLVPSVKTDLVSIPDTLPTLVWFGHSSYLIKANGLTILMDPVLSGYASPV